MASRDIVVIGASAGGVETLTRLMQSLPPDLPAAIFVVLHTMPGGHGLLAQILARRATLPVTMAKDKETIRQKHVYVAPPDFHLLLTRTSVHLSTGPTHNRNRPAIDPLFESAARVFGPRAIGIVLTGFLDDGSEGLAEIQDRGGYTIVQDPADALVSSMPRHALLRLRPDACLSLADIPATLDHICREQIKEIPMTESAEGELKPMPTTLTCPECHGVLNQVGATDDLGFECQVGHSFSPGGLIEAQNDDLERALWAGVRSLEEGARLSRKMASLAEQKKRTHAMEMYRTNAPHREQNARVLKDVLEKMERHDRDAEIYEATA